MDADNRNQQSQREKFPTERQRPLPVFAMDAGNRNQQSQREKFPTERQRPLPVFEHEEESSRPDVQSSSEGRHTALQPSSETRRYSSSTHQSTNSTRKRKNKIHPAIDHQLPDFEHEEESSRPDVQSSSERHHNPFTFQPSGRHRSSAPQPSSERHSSSAHQPTNSTRKRKNHPAIETTPERNPTPKRRRKNRPVTQSPSDTRSYSFQSSSETRSHNQPGLQSSSENRGQSHLFERNYSHPVSFSKSHSSSSSTSSKRQNHSSEQNYEKSHPATESFSKKTKNHSSSPFAIQSCPSKQNHDKSYPATVSQNRSKSTQRKSAAKEINFSSLVRTQIPPTDTHLHPKDTIAKKRIKESTPTQDETSSIPIKPCSSDSPRQNASINEQINSAEEPKAQTKPINNEELPDLTAKEQEKLEIETALSGITSISSEEDDLQSKPPTPTRPVFNTSPTIDFQRVELANSVEPVDRTGEIHPELTNAYEFDTLRDLLSNFPIPHTTEPATSLDSILDSSFESIPVTQTSATETLIQATPSILPETDLIQPEPSPTPPAAVIVEKEDCSTQIPNRRKKDLDERKKNSPKTLKDKWTVNHFVTKEFLPFKDTCEARYKHLLTLVKEQTDTTNYQYITLVTKLEALNIN